MWRVGTMLVVAGVASAAVVSPASALRASQDVLLFHADERRGTVAHDSSGFGNDGVLQRVGHVRHGSGRAYSFVKGTRHSLVTVPASRSLNPGTRNFSLSTQFRLDPAVFHEWGHGAGNLFRRGSTTLPGASYKMEMRVSGSGKMTVQCAWHDREGNAAYIQGAGASVLDDGAWHVVTCTKTSTAVKLNVDGKVATKPADLNNLSNPYPLYLGVKPKEPGPGYWQQYVGLLDEIHITRRAPIAPN